MLRIPWKSGNHIFLKLTIIFIIIEVLEESSKMKVCLLAFKFPILACRGYALLSLNLLRTQQTLQPFPRKKKFIHSSIKRSLMLTIFENNYKIYVFTLRVAKTDNTCLRRNLTTRILSFEFRCCTNYLEVFLFHYYYIFAGGKVSTSQCCHTI